jgi:hypothetical protein
MHSRQNSCHSCKGAARLPRACRSCEALPARLGRAAPTCWAACSRGFACSSQHTRPGVGAHCLARWLRLERPSPARQRAAPSQALRTPGGHVPKAQVALRSHTRSARHLRAGAARAPPGPTYRPWSRTLSPSAPAAAGTQRVAATCSQHAPAEVHLAQTTRAHRDAVLGRPITHKQLPGGSSAPQRPVAPVHARSGWLQTSAHAPLPKSTTVAPASGAARPCSSVP